MKKLSARHNAAIETPSSGGSIGVSTAVRKYWRKFFIGWADMLGPNDKINHTIANDYAGATPMHRFILRSGEPCEIRKSLNFLYFSVIRKNKRHDIIAVQPSFKEVPENIKSYRLTDEWLEKALSGQLKQKGK